jgi:hypothetical protein
MIRKKFNSATTQHLEKHRKQKHRVAQTEEKVNFALSTGASEEHKVEPKNGAQSKSSQESDVVNIEQVTLLQGRAMSIWQINQV